MHSGVLETISQIPKGKVATYKQIASLSGIRNPRVVGNILHQNQDPERFPCHRVVNFRGQIASNYAFGGGVAQRARLEKEGIIFENGKIDLQKFQWQLA